MRWAICNETYDGWDHARACKHAASVGYTGWEIAPFTLAPRITDVTREQRRTIRAQAEDAGLQVIGLHWLLAKTTGLMLTSPDEKVRQATADYLAALAECCAGLGGDMLVFGSPAQRRIPGGATKEQAEAWAIDTFKKASKAFADHGVTLCVEPLSPPEADFLNTAAEAEELIRKLDHPSFRLHLDVKAMSTDGPAPDLIRRHAGMLRHFHANDPNKRGPGFGETDFVPIFQALKEIGYEGWVSVEVFDYAPDAETIASKSIEYMKRCWGE
ncbi:MAG: sugar phosphate isomerase/epimerase [Gemmataceae bacterium]|nr:sugar phosphate isomerase/epimerase [Gemmataceae bacterium]